MSLTKKGDFVVMDRCGFSPESLRPELNTTCHNITIIGKTLTKDDLFTMATKVEKARTGIRYRVTSIKKAISVIETGGWTILRFLN